MLVIYVGKNTSRNQSLRSFCESHGVTYSCKDVSQLTREEVLALFAKTNDCFDLLSPSLKRYKSQKYMKLSELVTLIVSQPYQYLRLPIVVVLNKVYPDMTLEQARNFLPREWKENIFKNNLLSELEN
ncbi:hypothetical protein ACVRZD_09760 [Streptococcus hongkongensis]|nr:arsenate reductase [Streptococcus uberis]